MTALLKLLIRPVMYFPDYLRQTPELSSLLVGRQKPFFSCRSIECERCMCYNDTQKKTRSVLKLWQATEAIAVDKAQKSLFAA